MRIITGSAKGTRLRTLDGLDTRPTSEKVKEAIFSMIQFDIEGRYVLDLFAGSGQLGLEALSRGAAGATFVDNSRDALNIVRDNVEKCKFASVADIRQSDYRACLQGHHPHKYGIVFLDPPYGTGQLKRALQTLSGVDIVAKCGIIVCESEKDEALPQNLPGYTLVKEASYGRPKVTLYVRNAEDPSEE